MPVFVLTGLVGGVIGAVSGYSNGGFSGALTGFGGGFLSGALGGFGAGSASLAGGLGRAILNTNVTQRLRIAIPASLLSSVVTGTQALYADELDIPSGELPQDCPN